MKKIFVYFQGIALALSMAGSSVQADSASAAKIAPEVRAALASLPAGQMLSVIVQLTDRADLRPLRGQGRKARLTGAVQALQAKAKSSQAKVLGFLEHRRAQGLVAKFTPFWVMNGLSITATADVIQELAAREDVASITPDDINVAPASILPGPPEPNLSAISAPNVWSQSFYGQGIVVANLDSGVDVTHPALTAKWRSGTNSWYDPYGEHPSTPTDLMGHGTWTMGVMVGGDGDNGESYGIAPQARWIAAKIFKDNGTATATGIHQAFQWLLDPDGNPATDDAPHVVNNSWAFGAPGCNLEFQPDLQALVSAGIVPVFSAGNYGPAGGTSVSPANYPEAFAVGATDNSDRWYSSSSVGPSACGETSSVYPEMVAPGVSITTTDLYGLYANSTGTSMAAPHVTGTLALLLNAYPNLTLVQQEQALINSPLDLGVPGPDNIFGYGRLNVLAAYDFLLFYGDNPPPADTTGPLTSIASASPSPNNGTLGFDANTPSIRVSALVNDPISFGVQSGIGAAEVFIDSVGANGTGIPAVASDGVFSSPTEMVNVYIPLATIAQFSEGTHTLYVHGQDTAGNWGVSSTTTLVIDKTPPTVGAVNASPNPSDGTAAVTLFASAADTSSSIVVAAEWFTGADPGAGHGTVMNINGAGPWGLTASINTSTWAPGNYTLSVRARDTAGNWSSVVSTVLSTVPADTLFTDGFESVNFAAWNGGVTGTRLSVTTGAALVGAKGMQATLGGTAPGYVTDVTPTLEPSYHARFYFNPHGVLTGKGKVVTLFSGLNASNATFFEVQYQINGSAANSSRQVRLLVQRARGSTTSNWFTIDNNVAHPIEIAWQSATSASASLYTDGILRQTLTGLDTSAYRLDTVRLGPSAGLVSTASGTLYFDAFASTRNTVIGP